MCSLCSNDNTKPVAESQAPQKILLNNERFSWKEKKQKTERLSELFRLQGNSAYATRAQSCATFLEFNFQEATDMASLSKAIHGKKQLSKANFCQLRVCPLCNARRSAKLAVMLSKCINAINTDHPGTRYLFLTLAMRNCTGDDLPATITRLLQSYHRLMNRRPVKRAIKGAFRTMEITYNALQNTYHPHLHILLAVEDTYFLRSSGLYLTQAEWVKMWSECLKVDYRATANIKKADGSKKAIAEVSKYAVKDTDFLKLAERSKTRAAEVLRVFTTALHRRRLIQASGWFKDHWNEQSETDLLHITEDGEARSSWYGSYRYGYKFLKDYFLHMIYQKAEDGTPVDIIELDDGSG